MAKKLHYFQLNGIGEAIRYILHYGGQKFEDVRYDRKTWPDKSVKDSLPYGKFPVYEEGNKTLNQSVAIARYLASQLGLLPTDPWDQAVLDAVVLSIYDFWRRLGDYIVEPNATRKEDLKKTLKNEHVDFFYSRFEKQLKDNQGYCNGKLSWADFILVGMVEVTNLFLDIEVEKRYPFVMALLQKIHNAPGVKEYIATRKPYTV